MLLCTKNRFLNCDLSIYWYDKPVQPQEIVEQIRAKGRTIPHTHSVRRSLSKKRRAAPGKRLEGRRENFLRRPSKSFESQSAAAPPFSKTEFAEPRPEFVSGQGKRLVFRREAANYIRLKLTTTAAKTIETIESSLIRILIGGIITPPQLLF